MTKMITLNASADDGVTAPVASARPGLTALGSWSARLAAALISIVGVNSLAWCADLTPPPVAAQAAYSWSGLYIGLNAGYAAAKVTETVTGGGSGSANIPAGLGGLQIGANVQTGAIVWGFEGDFAGNMATKSVTVAGALTGTAQIPWLATLRGRVGYAFDRYLLYVTAGGAATELKSAVTVGAISSATTSSTAGAWTAGGGFEAAFTDNLSARIEYLYLDARNINVAQVGPPFVAVTGRLQDNLVRAGVNYRFPVAW
jgi:outer membrane immunogenic protein